MPKPFHQTIVEELSCLGHTPEAQVGFCSGLWHLAKLTSMTEISGNYDAIAAAFRREEKHIPSCFHEHLRDVIIPTVLKHIAAEKRRH